MKTLLTIILFLALALTTQAQSEILASLTIEAIDLNALVVESPLDRRAMWVVPPGLEVGWLYGTAQLGATGNTALAGHVALEDGSAGVFNRLDELVIGDIVIITLRGDETRYEVSEIYVTDPYDLTPLYPTTEDRLTLVTCHTLDWLGQQYLERLIIVALPI